MFSLFYFIFFNLPKITTSYNIVKLQDNTPIYMNCQDIQETSNGFYGMQYFYNGLSNSGVYFNLDKITFYLWFNVHQQMILKGNQILFSLVDGYGPDSILNLMVYYKKDEDTQSYYIAVSNDKITPEKKRLSIDQTNDLFMGSWNYLLLSIDQTSGNVFINMKFFSTYDQQLQQTRDVLIQQKFIYSFGQHSRITNEQLYEQFSSYKACVNIANFYYINGWSTMDSEIYADYFLDLKFLLRPYKVSLDYDTAQLIMATEHVEFSDQVGINVYKNTQIVYSFVEQLASFTIGFWMKASSINSDFQVLSFTDDLIEQTSIGFGVDKNNNLLLYQSYSNKKIGTISDQGDWQHITAALLEISLDQNFVQTNQKKLIRVFVQEKEIYDDIIQNFLTYKRLVIGPVKQDNKGNDVIDIQDIKIFSGFGIITSNTDCLLFVDKYCLFCKSGTHYCKEQDPSDDTFIYNCPAQYKNTSTGCQPIPQLNCLRVDNNSQCIICADGYNKQNGGCQIQSNYIYQPYRCNDTKATYCEQQNNKTILANTITINEDKIQYSKLCIDQFSQYDNSTQTCSGISLDNCQQAQYPAQCYKCKTGYYLTQLKTCNRICTQAGVYKFRDSSTSNNQCIQYCPNRYQFSQNCTYQDNGNQSNNQYFQNQNGQYNLYSEFPKGFIDYYCVNRSCWNNELDLQYICLNDWFKHQGVAWICQQNGQPTNIRCSDSCKYCYGNQANQCLGCYDNFYFTPFLTTCLSNCSDYSNKFIYHNKQKMLCEYECPPNKLYQDDTCVSQCKAGYQKYKNKCVLITTVELYFDTQQQVMQLCPDLCLTCSSNSQCLTCINDYPLSNNLCQYNCYPLVMTQQNDIYICQQDCGLNDLIYDNPDFQGYSIKQCFQKRCGTIVAGGIYQTFKHQSDPKSCTLPCDDGYYGDTNSFQCRKCSDTCFKCQDIQSFCTECYPSVFFMNNACFENCGDKFSNYLTFECEGSCSSGVTLIDMQEGIKACVPNCGEIFTDYKYKLNGNCIKTVPTDNVYCVDFNCYQCSSVCKQCTGQLDTNCKQCYENQFLFNNKCVTDCGNLKYDKINWRCVDSCPPDLKESSGNEMINGTNQFITSCYITCLYNKYQFLNSCTDSQPTSSYCDRRTQYFACEKCSQQCKTCTTAYSNSCSVCNDQAFQYNTSCYYDCPDEAPFINPQNKQCVVKCDFYSLDKKCVWACPLDSYRLEPKKECFISGCPQGYYMIRIGFKFCEPCYYGCSTCSDGTNNSCESCIDGYYLNYRSCSQQCQIDPYIILDKVNGQCTDSCPIGSYLQLQQGQLTCLEECLIYSYSNICVTQCPIQTYLDGSKCLNCAGPCSACYGTQIDQCTQCDQGYYKDETTCYQQCPELKPIINIADQTCIQNCSDYLYLSKMICFTECPLYLYIYELNGKKECVEQCYPKSYLSNRQCYICDSLCKNCFGPNNGNCVECELPYYLYQQTCQLTCPQFYDTVEYVCKLACPVNLVAQNFICQLQCDPGYLVYNQNCLEECPSFTFLQDNQCFDCNLVCSTCFGKSENECTSCIDNYYLNGNTCQSWCDKFYDRELNLCKESCINKLEVTDQNQCVTNCPTNYILCGSKCVTTIPDGFYQDGNSCSKCNDTCLTCVSATSCSKCQTNFYLNIDKCENQCSNKYLFMDTQSKKCVTKCPSQLFHFESFNKLFCVTNCQYKYNGWCQDACPKGTYSDNSYCKQCSLNCEDCISFTNCSKCINGYYNENGGCLTTCVTSKIDRVNFKCVTECDLTLYQYNQECLGECPVSPLTYDYKMICYEACPEGTYQDGQSCFDCDQSCSLCIGPTNSDCSNCALGYYLEDQICTNICPHLYDQVNLTCVVSCPNNLLQDSNNCVAKCTQFQYSDSCVSQCPISTYVSNFICIECPPNCIECNSDNCVNCQAPTYLINGLCDLVCPALYDSTKNQCVDICPNQTLQFLENCFSECPENTYELNSECSLSCPKFMVPKINKCVDCPERCNECLDDLVCIACQDKYLLYEGQCYISCPLIVPYADISKRVCLTECTPDTYIKGFDCLAICDLIIFQNQCLDKCPMGYFGQQQICKPCRLECKECTNYDICTVCNENYYLEFDQCDTQCTNIKDLELQQCVDVCNKLLYKNVCYQTCPIDTYGFQNKCVLLCNDGYYGSDQWKCEQCPQECQLCLNETQCSKCNTGYFLFLTNCLEECPLQLVSDPIQNICQTACPKKTYKLKNQCLFDCPDQYYNDNENFQCQENCSVQQYLEKKTCYQCSIECDGCYDYGNNSCIKCQKGFSLDDNGNCIGTSCKAGYFLQNQSCFKCLHKCLTCKNDLQCVKCRGSNRSSNDCSCSKGYYDDMLYDDCQKCPCDECTSLTNCLTCKNNLQLPLCSCDRVLNDDWCITCEVAKVNIYFSDDLNQIIVYFGYLVTANLLNPFQPSSCEFWFDNSEVFGTNSTCYLSWNRYSIVIQLKPYSTINVGDSLRFKQSFYRDIDQGLCDNYFIKSFIENKVYGPSALQKPYVLFTVPSFVSTCKIIEVNQILLDGTGQRLQKVLSWQLEQIDNEDAFLQMDAFLAQQKNEMEIPMGILSPNVTYIITVKYMNIFERVNYTKIQFTTIPIQAPYIFLSYSPLKVNFYLFDCHVTFKDIENQFAAELSIIDPKNESIVFIHLQTQISLIYELSLNESLLPKSQQLLFIATTQLSIIKEKFSLDSKEIDIQFLQQDRFIGQDNQINARGYDRNIENQILSTKNLNYEWLCTNLNNLQPCKTEENQIILFSSKRVIYISTDTQNTTFAFYVKVSKDKRWTVREQLVVLQSFNIEENFFLNQKQPSYYINPNDEITIIIKNHQKYAFIMQQFRVLSSQRIKGKTLKFRLADISIDLKSPVYIYLIPGNESLSFQLNTPPQNVKFGITPLKGKSLEYFNYTIQNLEEGATISIYYYFSNSTLMSDVLLQQSLNGIPLITDSVQIEGQFQLPSGMSDTQISLLCVIKSYYGAKAFYNQQVYVERQNYQLANLVETFKNKISFSDLNSLHLMVVQLQLEQQQVCLKQCSGVGMCIQNKCQCPPGYYFQDCSGNQKQYQNYLDIINTAISNLIKLKIANDEDFKQFSQSLLFFSQFNQLLQNLSALECQNILQQYVNNTNNRLVEINQFSINLQYHNNQDYNYSEIDIRSIVNKNDLEVSLNSIVFMWNKTLFSQDSNIYFLQNYMKQFASNVIDLTLTTLGYEEEALYQIDTAKIYIIKTSNLTQYVNFSNYSASRFLSEASQEQTYYDIVLSVFLRNFYAYDGYFPYPDQIYPLYDYSIRHSNKKENIQLQQQISYKFLILNISTNLVCLTRNQTSYYWTDEFCVLDQIDSIYLCNCSMLAPTTIINDLNYLYQGQPPFRILLPNILLLVYGFQVALIIGVALKAKLTYPQISLVSPIEQYKYGKVLGIMRRRGNFKLSGSQKSLQYDDLRSSARNPSQNDEEQKQQYKIFNLNYFWQRHFLLRLVLKKPEYISLLFRCILLLERVNILLLIAEILEIYWHENQVFLNVFILLGAIIFTRAFENFIKNQIKKYFYMKRPIIRLFLKLFMLLLFISTSLTDAYLYFKLDDQTNIIFSNAIAFLCDLFLLDLLWFSMHKFLGEGKKKIIKEKIHLYTSSKDIQLTE